MIAMCQQLFSEPCYYHPHYPWALCQITTGMGKFSKCILSPENTIESATCGGCHKPVIFNKPQVCVCCGTCALSTSGIHIVTHLGNWLLVLTSYRQTIINWTIEKFNIDTKTQCSLYPLLTNKLAVLVRANKILDYTNSRLEPVVMPTADPDVTD